MSDWGPVLAGGAGAFGLSVLLVPVARRAATRWDVTDHPGRGKVHARPTPYLGGVAVAIAVTGVAVAASGWERDAAVLLAAAVLVGIVGLLDDVRTASPSFRLAVEVLAASLAFAAGARVEILGGAGDWALTVVWLVVLTNAYNLLDNMDGCLSSIAAASACGIYALAALGHQVLVGALAAALVGAAAGFLAYNRHPASIFLGDAGSLFIGFLLSAAALKLRFPTGHLAGVVAVVLIAGPALFDTTLVVISRVATHRPIHLGGRDHSSHRLARLGIPTPWVSRVLAAGAAALAALGVGVGRGTIDPLSAVPVALGGAVMLGLLLRVPVYDVAGASRSDPAEPDVPVAAEPAAVAPRAETVREAWQGGVP